MDRDYVHGNKKTLESFCSKVGRVVIMTRLVYRKVRA
jgi:hypothetical protein